MLYSVKGILDLAEEKKIAVPAFNIYNLECLMGVTKAVEETGAPVIFQLYSRLVTTATGRFLAPAIRSIIDSIKTPVAFHLDHGANLSQCIKAMRLGTTGVMIDVSTKPIEENIQTTREVVSIAKEAGVSVEGELGHVGNTKESVFYDYTEVDDAVRFVDKTGVEALAIMVGTAHGKYKKAPVLDIQRITEIHKKTGAHLVLHGGSGVPDEEIKKAVRAGVRKINFATDVCCAFIEAYANMDPYSAPLDVVMDKASDAVKEFALEKINLLQRGN